MQPQREPSRKKTASAEDVGLSRDDVEYILGTFREDGHVTKEGTFETIMDYFDRTARRDGVEVTDDDGEAD